MDNCNEFLVEVPNCSEIFNYNDLGTYLKPGK